MKIMLSTAARTSQFSKAMRRIRPSLQARLDLIETVQLTNPTWNLVLVAICEDLAEGEIQRIENKDDCLQVMTGVASGLDLNEPGDAERIRSVFASLRLVVSGSGLTPRDYAAICEALANEA